MAHLAWYPLPSGGKRRWWQGGCIPRLDVQLPITQAIGIDHCFAPNGKGADAGHLDMAFFDYASGLRQLKDRAPASRDRLQRAKSVQCDLFRVLGGVCGRP